MNEDKQNGRHSLSEVQTSLPRISILIPCLNEATFIERAIRSIIQGGYPTELLEIVVLDGMSKDGTREILSRLAAEYPYVRAIDNPGASKPAGLNKGIQSTSGDLIVRLDAHAEYAPGYLTALVKAKQAYNADNVGPIRENLPKGNSIVAKCFAKALGHPFGVGNAQYNVGVGKPTWTDIVFLFCVERRLFDQVGLFDERLLRGQDREFNLRLYKAGYRGLTTNDARAIYYARSDFGEFAHWAIEVGRVPFLISRITGEPQTSLRNLVPVAFLLTLLSSILASFFVPGAWLVLIAVMGCYGILALSSAIQISLKERDIRFALLMPFVFFIWHLAYALGSLLELAKPWLDGSVFAKRHNQPSSPDR